MAETSTNMGLIRWTNLNDLFNNAELAQNFLRIDLHDHSGGPTGGVPIGTSGLSANAVTTPKIADQNVTAAKIADLNITEGKLINRAVTAPKVGVLPHARVFHNVNQAIVSATPTILFFNSERYDTDTIHDTAVNPGRLTCKTAGLYNIFAHIEWAANATGSRYLAVRQNGATILGVTHVPNLGTTPVRQSLSTVTRLATNDYLEVIVAQDSGAGLDVVSAGSYSPEFGMTFLSNY
jgi:hypothetical protein